MAWTASGLYFTTFRDLLDTTQLAIDLDLETHQIALYNNTETPDFSTETGYSVTNEVTGTGWSAGGVAVLGTTVSESPTGTLMFDGTDVSESGTTLSGVRGAKIYAAGLAGDNLIVGIDFGQDYATTNGTFAITWAAGGIFTIDLTP